MTERTSDGLDLRRRKLLFRCWHRGMREMDLIMGRFADSTLAELSDEELADLESLIELPDRDLLAWVTGEANVPEDVDSPVFRRMREFHHGGSVERNKG
jgi:antitoxin CptB